MNGTNKNIKKILMLFRSSYPMVSGADNMASYTAKFLSKHNEVDIILVQKSDAHKKYKIIRDELGTRIFIPSSSSLDDYIDYLEKLEPDLIHLVDLVDEEFCDVVQKLSYKAPVVVTPATDIRLWENRRKGLNICRLAKNIVTLTEYEEKNLIQELGSKYLNNIVRISQAPVISDEEVFDFREKYNISMDDQIILFLGRKIKSKGYHLLLKASSDIIKKHPNSKFIFIGPHYKGSKLIFERYKGNKAILDLGQVSEREKLSALQACNLLCLPSTADVFPLTFLEAWLCKKPVVSANFPGVKNIVNHGENGLITNTEIQSISANIQFLLENKYLAQLYGENGYQKVINQYSWEKVTENIQVLYEKIIEREVETYESSNNGRGERD